MECRVLFEDTLDVDVVALPSERFQEMLHQGFPPEVAGWPGDRPSAPNEGEFLNLVNDFWYHAVWTVKKLLRGELWTALERLVRDFGRCYELPVELTAAAGVNVSDEETARHLLLLVQQALMNAAKRAQASRVELAVEAGERGLRVRVKDEGVGRPANFAGRGELGGTVIPCTLPKWFKEGEAGLERAGFPLAHQQSAPPREA